MNFEYRVILMGEDKMKKIILIICLLSLNIVLNAEAESNSQQGLGLNLEITTGLQGSLSFAQIGINLPQFIGHFIIGLKFRAMSSLIWATFIHYDTKESVSFHPVVLAGILSFGGCGDMIKDLFRSYGSCEVLLGYSFTPYDSAIYNVNNLIGDNLTIGIFGTFGLEFFLSKTISVFSESGGGFKTLLVENKKDLYVIASSWLGSGVTFRMGAKIYF